MSKNLNFYIVQDPPKAALRATASRPVDSSTYPLNLGSIWKQNTYSSNSAPLSSFPTLSEMTASAPSGYKVYQNDDGSIWYQRRGGTSYYFEPVGSDGVYLSEMEAGHVIAFYVPDVKLVKYDTLKKMFGTYKQESDAALDAKFAALPSGGGGGVDTEAMNAAIDAKLETYTTERNEYVAQEIGDATSGLATSKTVTDAVSAAKTELQAAISEQMAKVCEAVNGVVLYDNTSNDKTVVHVGLDSIDPTKYSRIEVLVENRHKTGVVVYRHRDTASFDLTGIDPSKKSFASFVKAMLYPNNVSTLGSDFLFGVVQLYSDYRGTSPTFEFYCDDPTLPSFVLTGANDTAAVSSKPAQETWTYIVRVTGYPKLEVA